MRNVWFSTDIHVYIVPNDWSCVYFIRLWHDIAYLRWKGR